MAPLLIVGMVSTAAVGGFVFGWILTSGRCLHDWEPVVERELPSKAEELKKNGEDISKWNYTTSLVEIASKTFFAIISCKKCGAVKDFTIQT